MNIEKDLEQIEKQEKLLQFDFFNENTAWQIGSRMRMLAAERALPVAIDIQVNGQPLFLTCMPGSKLDNIDWIRRKKNVVQRFQRSSYAVGLDLQKKGTSLSETVGAELKDYAVHGGCFPIRLKGSIFIGMITVSGLPQRKDHGFVVEALAGFLGVPLAEVALADES